MPILLLEIAIKISLDKLTLHVPFEEFLDEIKNLLVGYYHCLAG